MHTLTHGWFETIVDALSVWLWCVSPSSLTSDRANVVLRPPPNDWNSIFGVRNENRLPPYAAFAVWHAIISILHYYAFAALPFRSPCPRYTPLHRYLDMALNYTCFFFFVHFMFLRVTHESVGRFVCVKSHTFILLLFAYMFAAENLIKICK